MPEGGGAGENGEASPCQKKLTKAKETMVEAAAALKACKDEAKEPRAMANKAGSKASKK